MLTEEQLHVHGFVGILRETSRVALSCRKTLNLIALFLILPLSYFFVDGSQSSLFLSMVSPKSANPKRMFLTDGPFWLFKIGRFCCFSILYLMVNAATAYTVASFYAEEHKTSFQKIMTSVFQKMLKQPVHTFLWSIVIVFPYYFEPGSMLSFGVHLVRTCAPCGVLIGMLLLFACSTGFASASLTYHLATLISVLEYKFSWDALKMSHTKVKGKWRVTFLTHLMFLTSIQEISALFYYFVIEEEGSKGMKIGVGVACVQLQAVVILVGLVAHAVLYFACKSSPSDEKASFLEDHHVKESSVSISK